MLHAAGSEFEEATAALAGMPPTAVADPNVSYAQACLLARATRFADAASAIELAASIQPALGRIARWDPLARDLAEPVASAPILGMVPVALSE